MTRCFLTAASGKGGASAARAMSSCLCAEQSQLNNDFALSATNRKAVEDLLHLQTKTAWPPRSTPADH